MKKIWLILLVCIIPAALVFAADPLPKLFNAYTNITESSLTDNDELQVWNGAGIKNITVVNLWDYYKAKADLLYQPDDNDLDYWAGLVPSNDVKTMLATANFSALLEAIGVGATDDLTVNSVTVGPSQIVKLAGPTVAQGGHGTYTALQAGDYAGTEGAVLTWRLPITGYPSAGTTMLLNVDQYGQMGQVAPSTFAAASHNHAGSEITSGTVGASYLPSVSGSTGGIVPTTNGVTDGWVITKQSNGSAAWATPGTGSMTWPSAAGFALYSGSNTWETSPSSSTALHYLRRNAANNGYEFGALPAYPTQSSLNVDDLITLSGVADGAVNLGAFTGSTISDNVTLKAAIQALETAVETKTSFNGAYSSLSGIPSTFAPSAHNHAGAEITSGTVGTAYLPTNTNTSAGIVASGSGQVSKVWKTDASGVPGWREDTVGEPGTTSDSFKTIATGSTGDTDPVADSSTDTLNLVGTAPITVTGDSSTDTITISMAANAYQAYDANMIAWPSAVSATEAGYLNNLTGEIQTQLNGKQATLTAGTDYLRPTTDVDDTPVNGELAQPVSSNWAYDHVAASDPHTGYVLESAIGSSVQAYDADLATYAGITPSANAQTLLTNTYAQMLSNIGAQASDATLTALAGLSITQGSLIMGTGADAFSILAKGTANQQLRMNSGATAFEWFTPSTHTQNTDTGTTSTTFQIDSGNSGPTLSNDSGALSVNGPIKSTATDASRRLELLNNTTAWSGCTSGIYGLSFDAGVIKICENGSKRSILSTATVTDGDKGDITVSNSGATWTIDNGAVTAAKIETAPALSAANMTSFPTLNQDTTGMAGSLKSTATTGKMTITGPTAGTTRAKTVRDANDTILELGGAYTPTGAWNWTSASGSTWPTFNQDTSGTAAIATTITVANEATDTTCFPTFTTTATGNYGPKTNAGLTFNSATGVLAATGFSGPLTGNVTGNATNLSGTPALPNGTTATTQTAGDNSTKLATTAYVATAVSAAGGGNVTKVGTPTNYQWGVWTGDGTLKGMTVTGSKVACTNANGEPVACTNLTDVAPLTSSSTLAALAASTSANLSGILSDETGSGAAVFATNPVFSTSMQIPNGANPTTDAAGEIAIDSSTGAGQGLRAYGAVAFTLPAYQTKCTTINAATASSDFLVERLPYAVTIRAAHVMQLGATNVVGHFDECDGNGANCAGIDGATDITATTTNANDDGTLSNASIDAGDYIQWHTTSVSGTNTQTIVCFDYTVDQVN